MSGLLRRRYSSRRKSSSNHSCAKLITISIFPDELIVEFLSYLETQRDFRSCACVSMGWNKLTKDFRLSQLRSLCVKIQAGYHYSVAVTSDGKCFVWGDKSKLHLPPETTTSFSNIHQLMRSTKKKLNISSSTLFNNISAVVGEQKKFSVISAGGFHTLAITRDGECFVWGSNRSGQLAIGTTDCIKRVNNLQDLGVVSRISAGGKHSLVLTVDNKCYSWGDNNEGQLGLGDTLRRETPQQIFPLNEVEIGTIAAGWFHSVALTVDGVCYCWGSNERGQLGMEKLKKSSIPLRLSKIRATSIACGGYHSIAIEADTGKCFTWGGNQYGQLGVGNLKGRYTYTHVLRHVVLLRDPVDTVSAGAHFSMAKTIHGECFTWGDNRHGQLGVGWYPAHQAYPTQVSDLPPIKDISAGGFHAFALTDNMMLFGWGQNDHGQLGFMYRRKSYRKPKFIIQFEDRINRQKYCCTN